MGPSDRLDRLLSEGGYETVWFARPSNFAWLTGGNNVVDRSAGVGVAAAGYDGDGVTVVTDTIEAPRLRAEELSAGVTVETFPWYETDLGSAVAERTPTPAAADFDVPSLSEVDATSLRLPLTDDQIARYRSLSEDAATTVEAVAREITSETSEREAAERLYGRLEGKGIATPVVLVGGERRAQAYRHYTPTDERVGGYALLSVTGRRDGLFTSLTRTVAFDAPPWLDDRTRSAMRVEATALAATRDAAPDGTVADVFHAIQDAYAAEGWDGEWQHHHQGGATGFAGREWIATPGDDQRITTPTAYAWNPTVQGAKSEDTCLVTETEVEPLTVTGDWPTETVNADSADLELDRHAVLQR